MQDTDPTDVPTRESPRPGVPYSLKMLWRDRRRFLPALLAIGLSAVLIAVQCGLVLGLVRTTSALIDYCPAQVWVLPRDASSLHQNYQLPLAWQSRLDMRPEVRRSEPFRTAGGRWRPSGRGTTELCMVVGMRLDDSSLAALDVLTPDLRAALAEPGAVAIDAWEFPTLGLTGAPYEAGEVNGQAVHLAGLLHGFHGFSFAYVFCSQETFRQIVPAATENPDTASCLVAQCARPEDVGRVVAALRRDYSDMGVYASNDLSLKVRHYWLFRSRGGAVLICTIVLALLVGLAVTSETLCAAVLAQAQEFAVLDALGIPPKHVRRLVMAQSLWLGVGGAVMPVHLAVALARVALWFHTQVTLSAQVLSVTFALTLGMAFLAGLSSLRALRNLEPAKLLR